MILLRCIQTILLVNPLLIYYLNPLKKIWSSGLTGKNLVYSVNFISKYFLFLTFSLSLWPSLSFEFRLRVSLSSDGNLILISRIRNINGKPFSFSLAYNTHFSVSDIRYIAYFLDLFILSIIHKGIETLFLFLMFALFSHFQQRSEDRRFRDSGLPRQPLPTGTIHRARRRPDFWIRGKSFFHIHQSCVF